MKILVTCDHGNNRSVHFAHLLKYWDNDVIPIGLEVTTKETLDMLFDWADIIVTTAKDQVIPKEYADKVELLDVGADTYPRPFNPELHKKAKELIFANKNLLKG